VALVSAGMRQRGEFGNAPAIAATFIGTVVGAGFASGQEIYQFFSAQGMNGALGLVLTVLLLGVAGDRVFQMGRVIQARSYPDFLRYILGKRLAFAVDLLLLLFFVILIGVMFAGSGTIFAEMGLGYWTGIVATAVILIAVLLHELPGLITANLIIIPLMFCGAAGVAVFAMMTRCSGWPSGSADLRWFLPSLQFSAYNLILALPVLLSLAQRYPFAKTLRKGGWLGSIGLGLMAALIHGAILSHLPHLRNSPLPMVDLARAAGTWMYWGYAFILWAEMLTTLFANTYGVAQRAAVRSGWPFRFWVLVLTMLGIAIARAGFVNLIARFYPLYGLLSLILLIAILTKRLPAAAH
jgi:uncharacterized membrane protein YkvI